ncbi:hypothetical protein EIP91_000265 [Steccherinum ochraceum]|uniref:F-box domain-containing protein n=1 Tax=Steccherinum ochraceum TaxID=92696 RepID=A0A4R0RWR9_9APHY|nr:hypothetical protein EIP91_000265 [Steccherinum ochraceum]
MSPPPALPLEVCELIIDAVDELDSESTFLAKFGYGRVPDRVCALRACALTCRAWLPRARMHLQTCRPEYETFLSTPGHLVSLVDFLRKAPQDAKVDLTGGSLIIAPSFRDDQTWVSRMPYKLGPLLRRRSFGGHTFQRLRLYQVDLSVVGTYPFKFYKSLPLIHTRQLIIESVQYSHLSQLARMVSILNPPAALCDGWFPEEKRVRVERNPNHPVSFRGNRIEELSVPVVWADLAHCDSWRFQTPRLSSFTVYTRWPNSGFTLDDGDNTFRSISKLFSLLPATSVEIQDVCEIRYRSAALELSGSKPNKLEIVMKADAYRRLGLPFVAEIIAQVMPLTIWYLLIKIKPDAQPSPDDVTAADHWSVIDDVLVRIVASEVKEHKPRPYRCWTSISLDRAYIAVALGGVDEHTALPAPASPGDAQIILDEIWKT